MCLASSQCNNEILYILTEVHRATVHVTMSTLVLEQYLEKPSDYYRAEAEEKISIQIEILVRLGCNIEVLQ